VGFYANVDVDERVKEREREAGIYELKKTL
jgi:hypothetical protein